MKVWSQLSFLNFHDPAFISSFDLGLEWCDVVSDTVNSLYMKHEYIYIENMEIIW